MFKKSLVAMVAVYALLNTLTSHGQISLQVGSEHCAPMNLTQAINRPLEWRAGLVLNNSSTEDVFVTCPMYRDTLGDTMGAVVRVANIGNSTVEIFCLFKEFDIYGGTLKSTRRGVFVPPNISTAISFGPVTVLTTTSMFSAACNLPPKTYLGSEFQYSY